jgi:hypothetical protein
MRTSFLKKVLAVAVLSSMAMTAWADDAPVFDVDNYPPQFDGQADAGARPLPPPPAPSSTAPAVSSGAPSASPIVDSQPIQQQAPVVPQSLTSEQRIARLEQQLNNLQRSESAAKLNTLQSEVQTLRGKLDDVVHQLQQMQSQQKAMYSDLDKRLNKVQAQAQAVRSDAFSTTKRDAIDTTNATEPTLAPMQKTPKARPPAPQPTHAAVQNTSTAKKDD